MKKIAGIHNYCDKWCEKCTMIDFCTIYDPTDYSNEPIKKNFEKVAENFTKTLELLNSWAEENNIDINNLNLSPEEEKRQKENTKLARENYVSQLAMDYATIASTFFEQNNEMFKKYVEEYQQQIELGINTDFNDLEIFKEALETIQWYSFQIHVKLSRAYHGILEFDEEYEDSIQNDHNGSAKVALIGIEKSITAWEIIMSVSPENNELYKLLAMLVKIRKMTLLDFPDVHRFIRPGFDD